MQQMIIYLSTLLLSLAGLTAAATGDTRASELLAQARKAIGGEAKVAAVSGLSCQGTFRRVMPDREVSGDLALDVQWPDRLLRTETFSLFGDATIVTELGVNGDLPIRRSKTIGGGPNMVVRIGGPNGPDGDAQAVKSGRADLARLAMAMLIAPPSELGIEMKYGGEAQSDDGTADVIEATGPGNFAARLFLEKQSHRLMMITYRGVAPVMMTRRVGPGETPPAGHEMESAGKPQAVDVALYVDDYRTVSGVSLPHHFSRSMDGKPIEEWTFKTIAVNPQFKVDTFATK